MILGSDLPVLIAGPCVVESLDTTYKIAKDLKEITSRLKFPFIFKASYDKANRTSHTSFRSLGFKEALEILETIRQELGVLVLTDVHEVSQIEAVSKIVDVLQIPAFLCRQTDILQAAGKTGLPVNIKRGQFMAPEDMAYAVEKVRATKNDNVFLTERGYSFGYHNLVVDVRAFPIMRRYAPVIFDVTHSVQMPGAQGGASGGKREFAPYLARAAAAAGVDGFFIETHPDPDNALSDGPNMIPLDEMEQFLGELVTIWKAAKPNVRILK
ncbi:MAG: 3-deoxy-8-phosphooctulonate synthase [Anaerolineae bacterium]|nr:3-deoxy-8-phosphooctulonate synthase [Anaerolineae bacterium]